jgi:hypothetical protein
MITASRTRSASIRGLVMMQCHFLILLTGFTSVVIAFAADVNLQQAASLVTHEPPAPSLAESFEVLRIAH